MSLSREQLRRRKAIRSWIPAAVLLAVIVAALAAAKCSSDSNCEVVDRFEFN